MLASRKKVLPLIRLYMYVQRPIHLLGQMLKSIFIKFHMWAPHVSMCNATSMRGGGCLSKSFDSFVFSWAHWARAHTRLNEECTLTLITNQMISFDCMRCYERTFWLNTVIHSAKKIVMMSARFESCCVCIILCRFIGFREQKHLLIRKTDW